MIRLEKVRVLFNQGTALEKVVLKNISLTIEEGEVVTVIGGNGAGKSTLLNVLTGDINISQGRIFFEETDVTRWSSEKRARMVARVFQDPLIGTCGTLTVEENLALAFYRGKNLGLGFALSPKNRKIFITFLERLNLGLEKRLRDPIGLLSGGQRQAISLIMAALSPMQILVLDEHTAALDPRTAAFIIQLTRNIILEKNLTVLMVTHSMHQALEVGNRTLMLTEGEIVFDVKGEERSKLKEDDPLKLFKEVVHKTGEEDEFLLNS